MKFLHIVLTSVSVFAIGTAAAADDAAAPSTTDAGAPATALPDEALTGQIVYQLLLAEIAANRGDLQVSVATYLDLARTTRDPRIARRAAEVAFYARQADAAMQAAQLWVDSDPTSPQARQMLASMMIASNRTEGLSPQLAQMLALDKENLREALLRLPRMLARLPDRQGTERLVDDLTAPYLNLPEAHMARAQTAQAAGEMDRALGEMDAALKLKPDWEQGVLYKAHLLHKTPAKAVQLLHDFLDDHPDARDVRLAYARSLVADKRYDEARRQFRGLLDAGHDDPDVIYAVAILSLQLNDRTQAETQFKRLLEMGYPESNAIRLQLGQLAEEEKHWDEAIRWYDQVTPGEQFVTAQARAAGVLAQQGKLDEARNRLHQAVGRAPGEAAQFVIAEALLLRDAGRPADAYAILDAALKDNPNQTDILYESALLAERIGKPDVLERNLRRLIELKPADAQAYNALGYSLADRNERLDEAEQLIDKALTLAPGDPFILDSKGWLIHRRGQNAKALEILGRAYAVRPDPEIAAHIGEVLWALGRRDEAERTWSDAAKANPGNDALQATIKKYKNQ